MLRCIHVLSHQIGRASLLLDRSVRRRFCNADRRVLLFELEDLLLEGVGLAWYDVVFTASTLA